MRNKKSKLYVMLLTIVLTFTMIVTSGCEFGSDTDTGSVNTSQPYTTDIIVATHTNLPEETQNVTPTSQTTDELDGTPLQESSPTPTAEATQKPNAEPTRTPTQEPTRAPTQKPTQVPTQVPTQKPTQVPTQVPTQKPTQVPTQVPTQKPTQKPTQIPTQKPTQIPTQKPTQAPSPKALTPIKEQDYFGRQWLSKQANSKALLALYNKFVSTANSVSGEQISISESVSATEFNTVWQVYRNDYPQHFWVDNSIGYSMSGLSVVGFNMKYNMTKSQQNQKKEAFDRAVADILSKLDGNMSQYELEKAIHEELIVNVTYQTTDMCHTAYGALVGNLAVCDGFSKAFEYLCRLAGVQAYIVEGSSLNSETGLYENHAWNLVCIDGDYCLVDVTWDNAGEPGKEYIHYRYFNLTTEEMNEDHVPRDDYGYPVPAIPTCTTTKYNYFVQHESLLYNLSVDKIVNCAERFGKLYVCRFEYLGKENVYSWLNDNINEIARRLSITSGAKISVITVANEYTVIIKT